MPTAVFQVAVLAGRADDSAALAHALEAAVRAELPAGREWLMQGRTELQSRVLMGPDAEAALPCGESAAAATQPSEAMAGPAHVQEAIDAAARRHAATYQLTLLGGLEGPAPDGFTEALHMRLRSALHAAQIPYQVLYGDMQARVQQARDALMALAGVRRRDEQGTQAGTPSGTGGASRLRAWSCEKCSDPDCEHQLFQRLIGAR